MRSALVWYSILLAILTVMALPGAPHSAPHSAPHGAPHGAPTATVSDLCARIDRQIAALDDIVMQEEISRYTGVHGRTEKVDEIDATVEADHGVDRVTDVRRNGTPCTAAHLSAMKTGAWSFGEFSALLRISREALADQTVAPEPAGDLTATFRYPASSGRWFVVVGPRVYWLDFQGKIRISEATGEALSISWISAPLQREADIQQIQRTVIFAPAKVGEETYTLPESAEYRVIHSNGRMEWNVVRFHNPARYGSLVSVTYDSSR